jgi:hypothetical protein
VLAATKQAKNVAGAPLCGVAKPDQPVALWRPNCRRILTLVKGRPKRPNSLHSLPQCLPPVNSTWKFHAGAPTKRCPYESKRPDIHITHVSTLADPTRLFFIASHTHENNTKRLTLKSRRPLAHGSSSALSASRYADGLACALTVDHCPSSCNIPIACTAWTRVASQHLNAMIT